MYARRPLFRLASPRLASFRFASKSEFLYRRAHTRIRVIYVDIGEKNQFVRSFLLDILILPSLFLLALCLLYLRKPTHCSVQLARENNSTPSFLFAHSSLTGKKGILDLPPDLVRIDLVPISYVFSTISIENSTRSFINIASYPDFRPSRLVYRPLFSNFFFFFPNRSEILEILTLPE